MTIEGVTSSIIFGVQITILGLVLVSIGYQRASKAALNRRLNALVDRVDLATAQPEHRPPFTNEQWADRARFYLSVTDGPEAAYRIVALYLTGDPLPRAATQAIADVINKFGLPPEPVTMQDAMKFPRL